MIYRPRGAILTLYGDYARHIGGEIGIGSLIKLMANFGLSQQSIRSAVSRMCRAGLLQVRHQGAKSYYSLTKDGFGLLDKGAQRIFKRDRNHWNGRWSIVVYFIPEERRQARDQLRQELTWIGYGPLSEATWISPHDLTSEVEEIAKKLQIVDCVQIFQAQHQGFSNSSGILSRCWNLNRIHKKYADFIAEYHPRLQEHLRHLQTGETIEPGKYFVERFQLIDDYRRLPFFDPDLPKELLPEDWLRSQAGALFDDYYNLLTEKAVAYFNLVLEEYQTEERGNGEWKQLDISAMFGKSAMTTLGTGKPEPAGR
ncbi:MAG: phenylacetic acid degradation operon negative regulatory protein PaaX [Chloroflexi bacterium]|nr:phenylacetic acid degradation operon negative regulatory protein PaaX [Chloroflexota bacterium]